MNMQNDNKTIPQDVLDTVRYYEELDTTDFPVANPTVLRKLRQRKEVVRQFAHFLDSETIEILTQHNTKQDYKRLENIIKAMHAPV